MFRVRPFAFAFVAVAVLVTSGGRVFAQAKFPLNETSGEKRIGGTSVCAWCKISRQSDKGLIEAKLWVRKSDIFGEGVGRVQFVFLDKEGNTIFKSKEVGLKVGADFLKGTVNKTTTADIDVPLDRLNATDKVLLVVAVKDTGAFDNDAFVSAVNELIGGARDQVVKRGMGVFMKAI